MKLTAKQLARGLYDVTKGKEGKDLESTTEAFIEYLRERHEVSRWREVVRALDMIWKEEHGAATVTIRSAHEIEEAFKKKLRDAYPGASITEEINEELIGGASIQIDDRIVDGTIAGALKTLKQTL